MEDFIGEIKKVLSLKESTAVGDIVILASSNPQMLVYALVTGIEPDPAKKGSWWNISMQVLSIPPRKVVWTLREPQFTGKEIFTFSGIEHFMQAVVFEDTQSPIDEKNIDSTSGSAKNRLRVIK